MRHLVSWQHTTTHAVEVEISLPELARWSLQHGRLGALSATHSDPAARLTRSLERNPHLLARLLQLYAEDTTDQEEQREKTKTRAVQGHQTTHPKTHTWTNQGESS
jgi:hypothetical protein